MDIKYTNLLTKKYKYWNNPINLDKLSDLFTTNTIGKNETKSKSKSTSTRNNNSLLTAWHKYNSTTTITIKGQINKLIIYLKYFLMYDLNLVFL